MSVTSPATTLESYTGRGVPPLGGWNLTFLWIEIRRLLRNRRTVVVTLVVPVVLFLLFKSNRRAVALGGIEAHGGDHDDRNCRLRGDACGDVGRRDGLDRARLGLEPTATPYAAAAAAYIAH